MSPSSTPVGDVVVGIVGALITIGLLTVAILWYRKTYRGRQSTEERENAQAGIGVIEPFTAQTMLRVRPSFAIAAATEPPASVARSTPNSYPPRVPGKPQENLGHRQHQNAGSLFAGRTPVSVPSAARASRLNQQTDLSPERRSDAQAELLSPEEVQGLRTEVENLMRAMWAFRPEAFEPPPSYASEPLPSYPTSVNEPVTSTSSRQ